MLTIVSIFGACNNSNSNTFSHNNQEEASIVGKWECVMITKNGEIDKQLMALVQFSIYEFGGNGSVRGYKDDKVFMYHGYSIVDNTLTIDTLNPTYSKYRITTLTKDKLVIEKQSGGIIQEFKRVE